jgi:PAS domain-containing protein
MAIGRERFPESADLHLFIAQFYVEIEFNRVFAYLELQLLQDTSSWLDVRFRAQVLQRQVVEASNSQQSDQVRAYVEFREHKLSADAEVALATRALVLFWSALLQPRPSTDELARHAARAQTHLARATGRLDRMLALHPGSAATLRLYARLCAEVLGDAARAEELLERAAEAARGRGRLAGGQGMGEFLRESRGGALDIFDDGNCVVTVSLGEDSFGRVLEANEALLRALGYPSAGMLVGSNVAKVSHSHMHE